MQSLFITKQRMNFPLILTVTIILICKTSEHFLLISKDGMNIPIRFGEIFSTVSVFAKEILLFMLIFFILNLIFVGFKLFKFGHGYYAFE